MDRNTELISNYNFEGFDNFNEDSLFDLFSNYESHSTHTIQDDIENPKPSVKTDFFASDDQIVPYSQDSNINQFGDLSSQTLEMDEENLIAPAMVKKLSARQEQPKSIESQQLFLNFSKNEKKDEKPYSDQSSENSEVSYNPNPRSVQKNQPSTVEGSEVSDNQMEIENSSQDEHSGSSSDSKKPKKILLHLLNPRNPKGERNALQRQIKGYWNNNLLRWCKKYHLDHIIKCLGRRRYEKNTRIYKIFNKTNLKGMKSEAITMADYVTLYSQPELEEAWKEFFQKKMLFRYLMQSKTNKVLKMAYVIFLPKFQIAFKTKKFRSLSRIKKDDPNI